MIRVKCPKCETDLKFDDSKAGGVGTCEECGQRFRIPGKRTEKPTNPAASPAKPTVAKRATPAAAKDKAAPAPKKPPKKKDESWMDEDSSPYAVVPDAEPPKPKKRRRSEEDENMEDDDYGYDKEYLKRRREKKKETKEWELIPGVTIYAFLIVVSFLVGDGAVALAVFKPETLLVPVLVGWLICLGSAIWIRVVAFQDSIGWGLAVFFIPLAALIFVITHWETARRPFLLYLLGVVILAGAIITVGLMNGQWFDPTQMGK